MSEPESTTTKPNWPIIFLLLGAAIFFLAWSARQTGEYRRSVGLEIAAGIVVFLAIRALMGDAVDDDERPLAYVLGGLGIVGVAGAAFTTGFSQSALIEFGMAAVLFAALDVFVVARLKKEIRVLRDHQAIWIDPLDEILAEEERERIWGEFLFGEGWEPGTLIGGFGGIAPEDHERVWNEYHHDRGQDDQARCPG
jgi:hypothetical protein